MTEKPSSSALQLEVKDLIAQLRAARDPSTAAACCEALAARVESAEKLDPGRVGEAGRLAATHAADSDVMLALGRLYLACDLLDEAYRSLSEAVRIGAGRRGYRLLGETLLRLGDAQIAKPMLKRAISAGCSDAETRQWYDTAKAYIPMQEAKGIAAVALEVKNARSKGATPARVPPLKPPPPKLAASVSVASKRTGASGAWRLGWLGSRVATSDRPPASDRPPPVTPAPATKDLERSLPRFEIPGLPGSGRRAPDPVVPGLRKPPKPPPAPAAETRTRTDAPVTVDLGSDDLIDFDLDRDGHDVEVIPEQTGPIETVAVIPPPPPTPKKTSPTPSEAKADAKPPAPPATSAAKLVDERLWHSEINIRLPPAPSPPRRGRRIAIGAGLVVLGLAAGFVLGRFSDRIWSRDTGQVAAASSPESEHTACVTATPTTRPSAAPSAQAKSVPEAAKEPVSPPPAVNAHAVANLKPLPPGKMLAALSGVPATQGLTSFAVATAADALLSRGPARPIAPAPVAPVAPGHGARPKTPAAPAAAPAPTTKKR